MKAYGDIVRLDIVDSYSDLSGKTLKMFSVLPQKIDADFYFKVDDDVAVNIDAMETYLTAQRKHGNLYLVRHAQVALLSPTCVIERGIALQSVCSCLSATLPSTHSVSLPCSSNITAERFFPVRRANNKQLRGLQAYALAAMRPVACCPHPG